jgi:hypothetical protein
MQKRHNTRRRHAVAEKVWVVHRETWELRLMRPVDAKEAVRLGDYLLAPVGGYEPPHAPARQAEPQPEQAA